MMLLALADIARKAGLQVTEVAGWKTRGHGPQIAVRGITCHHTANGGAGGNAPSLDIVTHGRPGLPGPLAHYVLGRDGRVYVVAAGLCYHAGVSKVVHPPVTNSFMIGIEAEAAGDGRRSDWPPVQMAAYHQLCKALMEHYGLPLHRVLGHKETCAPHGRKTDPSFDMASFRDGVKHASLHHSPEGDDEMQLKDDVDLTPKAEALMGEKTATVRYLLQWPPAVQLARQEVAGARADVAALTALVTSQKASLDALAASIAAIVSNQPAAIQQAFTDGVASIKAELAKIEITVATGPAGVGGQARDITPETDVQDPQ